MRKLPIGIQTFEDIRKGDYLYVDKTAFVYQIAQTGKPYFLSRPRRFGKSLLISTFEAYFQGRKDLFQGLAIDKLEKEWIQYPVLHLDLNAENYKDADALRIILSRHLNLWEDAWGREEREITVSDRFSGVIRRAYEQTGKQVVVLIDEYDKPLIQALLDEKLLDEYRRILKGFYGVLKSADRYLRFVFLTGVIKFLGDSLLDAEMNQFNDISLDYDYNALCGFTEDEINKIFPFEIENRCNSFQLSKTSMFDKLAKRCGGYHFCRLLEDVYNPILVLKVFAENNIDDYCCQDSEELLLLQNLSKRNVNFLNIMGQDIPVPSFAFTCCCIGKDNLLSLFYSLGYQTIKSYDKEYSLYTLNFPNIEMRRLFEKAILRIC